MPACLSLQIQDHNKRITSLLKDVEDDRHLQSAQVRHDECAGGCEVVGCMHALRCFAFICAPMSLKDR